MFRSGTRVCLPLILALVAAPAVAQQAQHDQHPPSAAAGPAPPAPQQGEPAGMTPGNVTMPGTVINNTFNPTGPTGTGTFSPTANFVVRVNDGPGSRPGMMDMMSAAAGHVEGRIAFLKAELKITDAQLPLWNAVAGAMRDDARSMAPMAGGMMMGPTGKTATLPERLAAREKTIAAHLDTTRKLAAAVGALYAALSDEQKKVADELTADMGHGMMMDADAARHH